MIKIGIIGCGKIAAMRHAPEYHENPNCALIAWYNGTRKRAEDLANLYGGTVCDSVDALLATDIDAVSVCVANVAHADITIRALRAGKHVLCEKPMATTLADCEAMNAAARNAGKFLMIAQNQRLMPAHIQARAIVTSGALGRVISFETHFGHPGPERWTGERNSWFFDKSKAAFGALADLGVHKIDLVHYLLGDTIVDVFAALGTLDKTFSDGSPITVDDNAFCICRTAGGAMGTVHVSWTCYGKENNATILYGTSGTLRCYDDPQRPLIFEKSDGSVEFYDPDCLPTNKDPDTGGYNNSGVIDAFIESIATNTPPAISGEDAIEAMRVIFASQQSAETGRRVMVQ